MADIANMGYLVDAAEGADWADGARRADRADGTDGTDMGPHMNALFFFECLVHKEF